jgi:hypothetical protein
VIRPTQQAKRAVVPHTWAKLLYEPLADTNRQFDNPPPFSA